MAPKGNEAVGRVKHEKPTPEPEEVPPEARYTARGLQRWIQARRDREIPKAGLPLCTNDESCILHDHE